MQLELVNQNVDIFFGHSKSKKNFPGFVRNLRQSKVVRDGGGGWILPSGGVSRGIWIVCYKRGFLG